MVLAKYIYEEEMIFSQHIKCTYTLIRKGCPNRNLGKYMSGQFTKVEIEIANNYGKNVQFCL